MCINSIPIDLSRYRKRRCAAAGVEGRVSGHSLRVGSAQSLAAAGAGLVGASLQRRSEQNLPLVLGGGADPTGYGGQQRSG